MISSCTCQHSRSFQRDRLVLTQNYDPSSVIAIEIEVVCPECGYISSRYQIGTKCGTR